MIKKYSLREAVKEIGDGATYRTVNYYKDIYTTETEKVGNFWFVSQTFIDRVKKNRLTVKKTISEPRTKTQLLAEIEKLKSNSPGVNQEQLKEIADLKKANKKLKDKLKEFENSTVLEDVKDGDRIELFSQEEYALFEERLIQWRLQRQEIDQTKIHFASLKEERDFIKSQLEYFKSSNDKILQQHQNLIEIIGQRNRIEAVEKGAIPKEPREI